MFRTVPLSIIRGVSLYTQQCYMSYGFADSLRAGSGRNSAVSKPVCHVPLLCVQWKTSDDGQRNCPKHVEFYSKNKFETLVHLVGFIVRRWEMFVERKTVGSFVLSFSVYSTPVNIFFGETHNIKFLHIGNRFMIWLSSCPKWRLLNSVSLKRRGKINQPGCSMLGCFFNLSFLTENTVATVQDRPYSTTDCTSLPTSHKTQSISTTIRVKLQCLPHRKHSLFYLIGTPTNAHTQIVYIKTFKNAPTCFDHSIIIRELSVPC